MSLYSETDKAQAYSPTVLANMERETGKTLEQWVEIALTIPVKGQRNQVAWFKQNHGLMQTRALHVLTAAFPDEYGGWDNPEALVDALFAKHTHLLPLYHQILLWALDLGPDVVASPRKTYVPLVAKKQFAVLMPHKKGLILGLAFGATAPDSPRLISGKALGGGDRVKHHLILEDETAFDAEVKNWLALAYAAGR